MTRLADLGEISSTRRPILATAQVDKSYVEEHMRPLNDLFALSEACLLADVIQLAADSGRPFDAAAIGDDVSKAVGWAHLSRVMHDTDTTD